MNIDWFTFAVQIVNFLILLGLLRWFLYGPIVRTMEQREAAIDARMQQAEQKWREGDDQARHYQQRIQEINEQREARLRDAQREADEQRLQLTKQAREDVRHKRIAWFQAFERERKELLAELLRRSGQLSLKAARHTLEQLADESLEDRMLAAFKLRLQELDDQRREEIISFLGNGNDEVFVRSAFKVSEDWQRRLRATVREEFGYEGCIDFQESADLICGIELEAGGYGFGWNVDEFLRGMEAEFDERIKTRAGHATA